jgi:hypothetical protein
VTETATTEICYPDKLRVRNFGILSTQTEKQFTGFHGTEFKTEEI